MLVGSNTKIYVDSVFMHIPWSSVCARAVHTNCHDGVQQPHQVVNGLRWGASKSRAIRRLLSDSACDVCGMQLNVQALCNDFEYHGCIPALSLSRSHTSEQREREWHPVQRLILTVNATLGLIFTLVRTTRRWVNTLIRPETGGGQERRGVRGKREVMLVVARQ